MYKVIISKTGQGVIDSKKFVKYISAERYLDNYKVDGAVCVFDEYCIRRFSDGTQVELIKGL